MYFVDYIYLTDTIDKSQLIKCFRMDRLLLFMILGLARLLSTKCPPIQLIRELDYVLRFFKT